MRSREDIGVVFGSLTPPEELARGAKVAEELGFTTQWFSEDCFFSGGLSGMAQMLASTQQATVGLGLASIMTRHPAILAMELAGLSRMRPGRLRAAIGLGNEQWLRQMGLFPARPLTAVRETVAVLHELLAGSTVDRDTASHEYRQITLDFPPPVRPEIWVGAVNERALRTAGDTADGVLLSVLAGVEYVRWATDRVAQGTRRPPTTAYVLAAVDDDPAAARDAVRGAVSFFLQAESRSALVARSRYGEEVGEAISRLAPGEPLDGPDRWIDEYAAAGDAETVASRLRALLDSGAASLGLWLFPPDRLSDQLHRFASDVIPRVE